MGSLLVFVRADKELQVLKPYPYVTTPSKCFCSCLKWIWFCTHPSSLSTIYPKDKPSTKNTSLKISCHFLMLTHTWIHSRTYFSLCSAVSPYFFCIPLHLSCLSLPFPCTSSLSPMFSFDYPCACSLFCLTFVSASSSRSSLAFVAAAVSFLLLPQGSSAKLGAAAPLWCSMHF